MDKRTLGQNLEVSALGLGCMGMSFGYGQPADKQATATWRPSRPSPVEVTAPNATIDSSR
jgi:hypothetical protein